MSKAKTTKTVSIVRQIRERKEKKGYAWNIAINHIPASSWRKDKKAAKKEAQSVQDQLMAECSLEELIDLSAEMTS